MKYLPKFLLIFAILMVSCGKKLPPPSPDIFPPKIVSANFYINNMIQIRFSEKVKEEMDSILLNGTDTMLIDYYFDNNVLYLQYNNPNVKYISIYGLRDIFDNSKDIVKFFIVGNAIKDTIKPYIKRYIYGDSIIKLICSEIVDSYNLEIYPEYVRYDSDKTKNKIYIHLYDTLGTYPIELIVNRLCDLNNNINNVNITKYFFNKGDSLFVNKIIIHSKEESLFVYNNDTICIAKEFVNEKDTLVFGNLMQGEYYIGGDREHIKSYMVSDSINE